MPPLILHPFSGGNGVDDLLEGSRASLALQGLLESSEEETVLYRRMLQGRYQEVRMLIFLGKDIFRWLQQCVEFVSDRSVSDPRVTEQSFAALVVEDPPEAVRRKLEKWGVTDRRAVFSRAIGLYSLFQDPPPVDSLSPIFLKNYHRFADHAYICFQHLEAFLPLDARRFEFEIYASEEYARILSDQWEQDEE
ncbi:MAG TPA: hypothetical protein VEF06_13580 [Bryobacteraceae bacterium]|nr:hypothetical protein [Bryobacteraceae bacterium]